MCNEYFSFFETQLLVFTGTYFQTSNLLFTLTHLPFYMPSALNVGTGCTRTRKNLLPFNHSGMMTGAKLRT